ncbi:DNA adenine methylase [Nocardia sp. N2S4-5]|uniref:DNA adenine methylase n=1 Tax=Nocardia sp. N2S4-5 TaxID=3351565 RepID=UPI0037CE8EB8
MLDKPWYGLADAVLSTHSVVSPLRYPGAKRQLFVTLTDIIKANVPPPRLLLEPFCGGATTSLRLAGLGVVEHVVLADADPLVGAFWYVAAFDTTWLVNAMKEESVTIERWDWWRLAEPKSRRDKALKCLFLNRTTFSGILHGRAGPIGGRAQKSPYKIDCRYGVEGLERRIRAVGDLANTGRLLDVWTCDWRTSLARAQTWFPELTSNEIILYLDPPYVDKAATLYGWSFQNDEHKNLATALRNSTDFRWVLSYDDADLIRQLYPEKRGQRRILVSHQYSAATAKKRTSRDELLVTNYPDIPISTSYRVIG